MLSSLMHTDLVVFFDGDLSLDVRDKQLTVRCLQLNVSHQELSSCVLTCNCHNSLSVTSRGVARNLLRGTKEGLEAQRGPGAEPRWGSGRSPQKPETDAEYSTEKIRKNTTLQKLMQF